MSDHTPSAEERLAAAERHTRLLDAIETLPAHERSVVALHYLAGQPVKAIAAFLSVSVPAVKKRLFSARHRLNAEDLVSDPTPLPTPRFEHRIALFLAIRAGDGATVRRILTDAPALLEAEEHWSDDEALAGGFTLAHHLTPLILAAGYGDRAMVDLLLALGASPEGRCGCANGETALWAAARAGHDEIVDRLEAAGASRSAKNAAGYDVDALKRWRARSPTSHAGVHGARVGTGLKALDLWLPLHRGDVVRVHGAAETGLTVLLSELTGQVGRAGGHVVWTSWEPRPWHRRELAVLAARAGVSRFVSLVTPDGDDHHGVLDRGRAQARASDAPLTLHVVFEQEGRRSAVEARYPELGEAADLTLVVAPWAAVTRGDLAPSTEEPHDALLCTDPGLAQQGLFPAVDPVRSRARRGDTEVGARARALLQSAPESDRAKRLLAYLTQPFASAEPDSGWPGVSVPVAVTERDVGRILSGELDAVPIDALRYRGALDEEAAAGRQWRGE